jgi:DNA-binding SARP family transcriptional activator
VIEARLLGPLELGDVELGSPRQRALLARLLLDANRTVAVERLIDDLWGEDAPITAVKMVHIYVSRLRAVLPGGLLLTRAPGYLLRIEPEAIDLVRFERLRAQGRPHEALALWRGPALAEFDAPFAVLEAERLEALRLSTIEDRIEADLALGRHGEVAHELDALVARHPLRERLRGQLMLALYRSGRQADALARYRRLRLMLADELGIRPTPVLRDLERRMLVQDPALELAA